MTHHAHHEQDQEPQHDSTVQSGSETPKQAMTVSLTLTPLKLFLAGLIAGLVVMAVPVAFLSAKVTTLKSNGGPAGLAGAQNDPSPLPAPTAGNVKEVSKDDHLRGDRNAPVVMIEYSDIECPFCKRFHPTAQQVYKDYNGKVAWVYRHFPLSFHQNAQKEAEATECAADVGGNDKFWEYLDKLFEKTASGGTGFAVEDLTPLAKGLGINEGKFKACLDGGKYAEKVQKELQEGQEAGVDGTPGTILIAKDGRKALVPGAVPAQELKTEIDKLLK